LQPLATLFHRPINDDAAWWKYIGALGHNQIAHASPFRELRPGTDKDQNESQKGISQ